MLLNNKWVKMISKKKLKRAGNKWKWTHTSPKPMGQAKAVLKGKFIAIEAYLNKIERSQINNLILHLQELEEQQQTKPRASRRKEIRGKYPWWT